jgi:hypothetical protein
MGAPGHIERGMDDLTEAGNAKKRKETQTRGLGTIAREWAGQGIQAHGVGVVWWVSLGFIANGGGRGKGRRPGGDDDGLTNGQI